jgi:hypothetical protein
LCAQAAISAKSCGSSLAENSHSTGPVMMT